MILFSQNHCLGVLDVGLPNQPIKPVEHESMANGRDKQASSRANIDNIIVQLAIAHDPKSIYLTDGSFHPDVKTAIQRILPLYDGIMRLPFALLINSPEDIKRNITSADMDTLLLFFKCLGVEASKISDKSTLSILGTIQNYILSVLRARMSAK
ncbi:MAG: hypothetical protein IK127_06220 [Clostridia bacterium]|nr:hypothetical protein [Clostridia bacterium]